MMEVKLLNLPFQNIQLNFSSNFCADYTFANYVSLILKYTRVRIDFFSQ